MTTIVSAPIILPDWQNLGGGGGGGGLFGSLVPSTPPTASSTGLTNVIAAGSGSFSDTAAGFTFSESALPGSGSFVATSSVPSTPFKLRVLLAMTTEGPAGNYTGLGFNDSSTGKCELLFVGRGANSGGTMFMQQQSTPGNYFANLTFGYYSSHPNTLFWLEIEDTGTRVRYKFSNDGVNFNSMWDWVKAGSYLGATGYNRIAWGNFLTGNAGGNGGTNYPVSPSHATILAWNFI